MSGAGKTGEGHNLNINIIIAEFKMNKDKTKDELIMLLKKKFDAADA